MSPDLASPLLSGSKNEDDLASPLHLSSLPSSPISSHLHRHHLNDQVSSSPRLSSPLSKMNFQSGQTDVSESLISRRNQRQANTVGRKSSLTIRSATSTVPLCTLDQNASPVFPQPATPTGHATRRPVKRKIAMSCEDHLTPTRKVSIRSSPFKRHSNTLHRFNSEVNTTLLFFKSIMNQINYI